MVTSTEEYMSMMVHHHVRESRGGGGVGEGGIPCCLS